MNARPATSSVPSGSPINTTAKPVWLTMNVSMDAIGPISYWRSATQKVNKNIAFTRKQRTNSMYLICSRRWFHMPRQGRSTLSGCPILALPPVPGCWRPTPSHHLRRRTSTSDLVRRRYAVQRGHTDVRRAWAVRTLGPFIECFQLSYTKTSYQTDICYFPRYSFHAYYFSTYFFISVSILLSSKTISMNSFLTKKSWQNSIYFFSSRV